MNYLKLSGDFTLPPHIDLSLLDSLPTIIHKYGDVQPPSDHLHWMTYRNDGGTDGQISFARGCWRLFPEVAYYVSEFIGARILIPINSKRVNFMKTRGSIKPHIDEGRACCVNIGIRNTECALTSFPNTKESFIVQTNSAYLVNVADLHTVVAAEDTERLLISYSFAESFESIKTKCLNNYV